MSDISFDDLLKATSTETQSVGMDRDAIIEALRHDCSFFLNFYLGDELTLAVPEFHVESWNLITAEMIHYIALALPRGHAKTTLCKLCCVWYLLFTDTRFIVYVSNTVTVAAEAVKDIVAFMRSDNHGQVFGKLQFTVEQEARGFYQFHMVVPDGRGGFRKKFCIIKALGAGQQVRGININNERPQLAIVDDLEDNDNTATALLQKNLKKWFFGAFIKALSKKRRKVIYLGNMLSNQSILYFLCEQSQQWHSIRYGCLRSTGVPLWADLWSFDQIREDFIEYQKAGLTALWFAEMMNMPMSEGTALVNIDAIAYRPAVLPEEVRASFITVDPAVSQKTWANDTALVVHGYVADRWQIVETVNGKFAPEQVFQLLMELQLKWNTRVVGIEAGALQTGLKFIFDILMKTYRFEFQLYEIPHRNRSKVERIAAWCAALKKHVWVLTEGDIVITQQLINFDALKANNIDDLIDACSMGIVMTEMYMPSIMDQYNLTVRSTNVTKVLSN